MHTTINPANVGGVTEAQTRSALYALPDILARGKFSKSHVYNMMARGHFPQPVLRMGPRFTRWSTADIDAWFAEPAAWIATNSKGVAT